MTQTDQRAIRLLLTVSDAIKLVTDEREHHALSYRSVSMIGDYAQLFPAFWLQRKDQIAESERGLIARWAEYIQITNDSAIAEHDHQYARVCARSTIVLSDVVENVVESILTEAVLTTEDAILNKLLPRKYLKSPRTLRNAKWAVRSWERSLFEDMPSRVLRLSSMLASFFPQFSIPLGADALDRMFEIRNSLTHEIVARQRARDAGQKVDAPDLHDVDRFFDAAGEFFLAILESVRPVPALSSNKTA